MSKPFFSSENPLFRFTDKVLDVVVLSALWLLCSLPVVTIGPATAALYYACVKCLRRQEPDPYRNFFQAFRENLKVGIGATVIFLLLGLLLDAGYIFLLLAANSGPAFWNVLRIAYCLLLLFPIAVLSCAFPLLSRFADSLPGLLVRSVRVTLAHPLPMLGTALLNCALAAVTLKGWFFGLMLLTPALGALLASHLLEPVLRQYTPDEPPDENGEKPWYLR